MPQLGQLSDTLPDAFYLPIVFAPESTFLRENTARRSLMFPNLPENRAAKRLCAEVFCALTFTALTLGAHCGSWKQRSVCTELRLTHLAHVESCGFYSQFARCSEQLKRVCYRLVI